MLQNAVSEAFLERLPIYLNQLKTYTCDYVSSTQLANDLNLGHVQVRKDLARISQKGKPKVGYLVSDLVDDIKTYLSFSSRTNAIIIGMGQLGKALYHYQGFEHYNIKIVGAFDINNKYMHMDRLHDFCRKEKIDIAIITTPHDQAQEISNLIVKENIKAIWNFAPIHLNVPDDVIVQNENLANSIAILRKILDDRRQV
jgi:redox-sensing transcriptional repressor